MDTFFAIVEDTQDIDAVKPLIWIGTQAGEFRDVGTFEYAFDKAIKDSGIDGFHLSEDHQQQLIRDRDANPPGAGAPARTVETPLQIINLLSPGNDVK